MRTTLILAALLATGCSGQQPSRNDSSQSKAEPAAPPDCADRANAEWTTRPCILDRADLIGRWTNTDGNCSDFIEYLADGTMNPGDGTPGLRWSINGDTIRLTGYPNGQSDRFLEVNSIGPRELRMTLSSGQRISMQRC